MPRSAAASIMLIVAWPRSNWTERRCQSSSRTGATRATVAAEIAAWWAPPQALRGDGGGPGAAEGVEDHLARQGEQLDEDRRQVDREPAGMPRWVGGELGLVEQQRRGPDQVGPRLHPAPPVPRWLGHALIVVGERPAPCPVCGVPTRGRQALLREELPLLRLGELEAVLDGVLEVA